MNLIFITTLILMFNVSRAHKDILPAFLLDYEGSMSHIANETNPFKQISSSDFADIVRFSIERSEVVIIFIEETLSIEDVTLKDRLGTPFYHLRQGLLENKVRYLPNVVEPYETLKELLQPRNLYVFYLNVGTKLELPDDFKYIYVFFENGVNETLAKRLRRHDMIIRDVYFAVSQLKQGPVIGYYTGKSNSLVIDKSQYISTQRIPVPVNADVVILSEGALFRFSGVYASTGTRRATLNQIPLIAEEKRNRWKLSTKMAYTDFELQFNFNLEDIYWWTLDTVSLIEGGEEVGRTVMYTSAPWDCSYVCGDPIVVVNSRDGSYVTVSKYQIQPIRPYSTRLRNGSTSNNSSMSFGPRVNCGPYFNTHILSGLMVTAVFISILTFGFTALYNCSSNSRYDDPNGKHLTNEVTR